MEQQPRSSLDAEVRPEGSPGPMTEKQAEPDSEPGHENDDHRIYPPRKVVVPAIAGLYLACFLSALDRTILGTAIPSISNEFNSFGDVAWYEAGYLLPACMLALIFGPIYSHYPAKWVLISQVTLFEIGSIVSATAPSSNVFIGGRAISGSGSAGIFSGAMILINQLLPLRLRPQASGGIGAMFGISSILGPILGGYLTSITWRWCFWINVPIGAISLVVLLFLSPKSPPPRTPAKTLRGKIEQLDPIGFILAAPAFTCLLFALQFGGVRYPWSNGRIIALFVLFGVLFTAFIVSQIWRKEKATIPPRILMQRSVLWGAVTTLSSGSVLIILPFYLPIWFQAIQGKSPQASGLSLLPLLLSVVVLVISCGILTTKLGYYTQWLIIGSVLTIVGSSLISTWTPEVTAGKWVSYQILAGAGIGFGLQVPSTAIQTVLSQKDITIGTTLLQFVSLLGGNIIVTGCQTLLQHRLASRLSGIIPDLDISTIANGGATSLRKMVPAAKLPLVLNAYNDSMRAIWYLALGMSCVTFLASFGIEWKSVKKEQKQVSIGEA